MDSKRINKLVNMYKSIHPDAKRPRNLLMKEILNEYQLILEKVSQVCKDKEEGLSIAKAELVYAIESYDVSKKVLFNTYFYYYLKGIYRIYSKNSMECTEDEVIKDDVSYVDFNIDLDKILEPEEILIFKSYASGALTLRGKPQLSIRMNKIIDKLYNYIGV